MDKDATRKWFEAVRGGDPEPVRSLLDAGADPESRTDRGRSALMLAAQQGSLEVLDLLLSAGAEKDATLAEEARRGYGGDDATHSEYDDCDLLTALDHAIAWGQTAAALRLLEAGASPVATAGDAVPPLVLAADVGDLAVVDALLGAGAPVDEALDATPLHGAPFVPMYVRH